MWKEKLGNYLIAISKYTLTAIFIASLFKDLEEMKWVVYGLSLFASACLLITGLLLTNKKKEDDK